jgi:hypothetical protein
MLANHRMSGFLSNFLEYSYLGNGVWPAGSQPGDIAISGSYSDGTNVTGTAGWTELIKNVQSFLAGDRMVAIYAKVLTATDISRGTTGLNISGLINTYTPFDIVVRPTRPLASISVTGLNTAFARNRPGSSPDPGIEITMTGSTQNPGFVFAHTYGPSGGDAMFISNSIGQTEQLTFGGAGLGPHRIALEFLREGMATTARTGVGFPFADQEYWQTIACITGQE